MVGLLEKCHACAILAASEATSYKKKRMISNKNSERIAKKFKAYRENLDTSAEEPIASEATSAGTASGKIFPSETRLLTFDNSSSIPSITLTSYVPFPHTFVEVNFLSLSSPLTTNTNVIIPSPSTSLSEILTFSLVPTP